MFKHLSSRIFILTIAIVCICTLIVSIFSYIWSTKTLYRQFEKISINFYNSNSNNLSQYLDNVAESSKQISTNPTLVRILESTTFEPGTNQILTSILSGLNLDIIGLTLYGKNDFTYFSNQISDIPSLQVLTDNPEIKNFIMSPKKTAIWVSRYKNISNYYNGTFRYRYGVLSYILKIRNEPNKILGYAIVDIDITKVFEFFKFQNTISPNCSTYIVRNITDVLPFSNNKADEKLYPADIGKMKNTSGYFLSSDGKHLVIYETIKDTNTKDVITIPLENAYNRAFGLKIFLMFFIIICSIFSVYLAYLLNKSIIRPLTGIYNKMKSYNSME